MHWKDPLAKVPLTTDRHISHALWVQLVPIQLAQHRLAMNQLLLLYLLQCVMQQTYPLFDAKSCQFQLVEVQDSCPVILIYMLAMSLIMAIDLLLQKVSLWPRGMLYINCLSCNQTDLTLRSSFSHLYQRQSILLHL